MHWVPIYTCMDTFFCDSSVNFCLAFLIRHCDHIIYYVHVCTCRCVMGQPQALEI